MLPPPLSSADVLDMMVAVIPVKVMVEVNEISASTRHVEPFVVAQVSRSEKLETGVLSSRFGPVGLCRRDAWA